MDLVDQNQIQLTFLENCSTVARKAPVNSIKEKQNRTDCL